MTIGVWVGRPDGAPVPGIIGRVTAAPILFDAFARAGATPVALAHAPQGALFATNNRLPPPLRHFSADAEPGEARDRPHIMFPPNGARLELADSTPVALKITGGRGLITVMVNGVPLPVQPGRHTLFFQPDGPGFVRLTVMDGRGLTDSVMVRLQ